MVQTCSDVHLSFVCLCRTLHLCIAFCPGTFRGIGEHWNRRFARSRRLVGRRARLIFCRWCHPHRERQAASSISQQGHQRMTRTKGKHLSDHNSPATKPLLSWPWQMPKSSMTHERSTIMDHSSASNDISHTKSYQLSNEKVFWCFWVSLAFGPFGMLRASAANSLLPGDACRPSAANKRCRKLRSRTWRHRGVTVAPYNLYILNWRHHETMSDMCISTSNYIFIYIHITSYHSY